MRRHTARGVTALWRWLPVVAAGLAAAIPVIRSTVDAVNAGWAPAGDDAIIATRGVLSPSQPTQTANWVRAATPSS